MIKNIKIQKNIYIVKSNPRITIWPVDSFMQVKSGEHVAKII